MELLISTSTYTPSTLNYPFFLEGIEANAHTHHACLGAFLLASTKMHLKCENKSLYMLRASILEAHICKSKAIFGNSKWVVVQIYGLQCGSSWLILSNVQQGWYLSSNQVEAVTTDEHEYCSCRYSTCLSRDNGWPIKTVGEAMLEPQYTTCLFWGEGVSTTLGCQSKQFEQLSTVFLTVLVLWVLSSFTLESVSEFPV